MKKINIELRNIYRTDESQPDPVVTQTDPDEVQQEAKRRFIFSLVVAVLAVGMVVFITKNLVGSYLIKPDPRTSLDFKGADLTAATLPEEEQWAIDYRHAAQLAENHSKQTEQEFSAKWLKNVAFHVIMGEQAIRVNDLDAARYHLEQANQTFPTMKGIQRNLGTVYLKKQQFLLAEKFLQQAKEDGSSVELLNNLGIAYVGLKDYAQAEAMFQQAIQLQPEVAGCYKNLSLMYQKKGATNDAMAALEKYFSLNPSDTPFLQHSVTYLTENAKNAEVIRILEQLQGADLATVQLLLAKAAAREKDAERAVRALTRAAAVENPRILIAEMHDPVFKAISQTDSFEALAYQLELAVVSGGTNQMKSIDFPAP